MTSYNSCSSASKAPTIVAPATAPGGALAIVRTSGPDAVALTAAIFRGRLGAPNTVHYGQIMDGDTPLDDALVAVFRAPHSYTGEDATEISLHGSPYIQRRVVELLIEHGARMAEPGEYTRRAFLNGKMDLSQAEAVADVIAAETEAQSRVAQTQLRGQYSQRLAELRDRLLHITSLLTLELDFSEEDVEFAPRTQLLQLCLDADAEITRLADTFHAGNALRRGIPVAIIGAPNVGKSTLLNQLLGDERAIVSPTPGTTRDLVSDQLTLRGRLYRIIDTAGLRHTDDSIEQLGIARTLKAAAEADIIISLAAPGSPHPAFTPQPHQRLIRRENKTPDFQALTGKGLDALLEELISAAPAAHADTLFVTNARHHEALLQAHDDLTRALTAIRQGLTPDLIAEDLTLATNHLAAILGTITTDDTLHHIFQHFCVGK